MIPVGGVVRLDQPSLDAADLGQGADLPVQDLPELR
jgi:hypothetical protein